MSAYKCEPFDRRDFVCCGDAALFTAVVTALIGSARPVLADPISGAVPEIEPNWRRASARLTLSSAFPPCALQGGIRSGNNRRAQGHRCRLHRSPALLGRTGL